MPKLSIVVPVYYNEDNLRPLYADLKEKLLDRDNPFDVEIVMVDDGSGDRSYQVMEELKAQDERIHIYHLSRNFGSDAAVLCGLVQSTGDCAVVKCADLQEPTEMIYDMYEKWAEGNNVVLAVREGREEGRMQIFFANAYYALTRKFAFPQMPKTGFSGQILWAGFRTATVGYVRRAREIGSSKWTLRKKLRLVADTLFSFSTLPITIVTWLGGLSCVGSILWALDALISKLSGRIDVTGWTMMFIFQLLAFGIIMLTLGLLGAYLWRTFDAARRRPPYLIERSDGEAPLDRRARR